MGNRGICFHCNIIFLTIFHQLYGRIADVKKDLVYHGFDPGCFKKAFQIPDLKVGNTDRLQLARLIRILQRTPCLSVPFHISVFALIYLCPWLWTVNDHHIQIIQSYFHKAFIDGSCCRLIGLVLRCNLAGNKHILPGNAAAFYSGSNSCFISVSLRRVNMTIPYGCRLANRLRSLIIRNKPCAKSQFGYFHSI